MCMLNENQKGEHTKVLALNRGQSLNDPFEEDMQVGDDDEGRGEAGARVVLHNQVVALELPVHIAVLLDFIECVTVNK